MEEDRQGGMRERGGRGDGGGAGEGEAAEGREGKGRKSVVWNDICIYNIRHTCIKKQVR